MRDGEMIMVVLYHCKVCLTDKALFAPIKFASVQDE